MTDETTTPAGQGANAPPRRPVRGPALPIAALTFVALCVLALAAVPVLVTDRLDALRDRSDRTVRVARNYLTEIRLLLAEELVVHQLAREDAIPPTPDTTDDAFTPYRANRAELDNIVARLAALAPSMDTSIVREVDTLRALLARWDAPLDARADGRLDEAHFAAQLGRTGALRDSLLDSHRRIVVLVHDEELRNRAEGERTVAVQHATSYTLGVFAVLAVALLAWLARRERRLTEALEQAVDEEARLRAESERRREDILRIAASKDQLVRGFTHDVRNPIGAADGYLQLVEDGITGPVTERQAASIGRARRAIRTSLALIGDLLEVARADTGNLDVERVPTDVGHVAMDIAEEYRPQAEAKGLSLAVDACRVPTVTSDPVRVRQVVGNLVSNAVKYTRHGSVTVRVVEHGADGAARCVVVQVIDTGPGIAADKRRLLFHEFTRLDPAAAPGLGLGLAMSRRIAEALGGELTVASEEGRGSTFALVLPLNGTHG